MAKNKRMKKLFLILAAALLAVSCEEDKVPLHYIMIDDYVEQVGDFFQNVGFVPHIGFFTGGDEWKGAGCVISRDGEPLEYTGGIGIVGHGGIRVSYCGLDPSVYGVGDITDLNGDYLMYAVGESGARCADIKMTFDFTADMRLGEVAVSGLKYEGGKVSATFGPTEGADCYGFHIMSAHTSNPILASIYVADTDDVPPFTGEMSIAAGYHVTPCAIALSPNGYKLISKTDVIGILTE